ncbi:MAG TPA: hypothetical protein VEJ19_06310 [Nitrososphaerales archaeon]|nr:hypothetical protein [Nitrososphaerales archaeon]
MYGQTITTRKRVTSAIWALVVNIIFWIVIPYYVGMFLTGKVPDSALTVPTFVYEFGIMFIILEVGAAFFQGKAVAVPMISAVALLTVVYVWYATNGGVLGVETSGITLALSFRLMLYVLVLPSIWAAIRAPLSYMVWRRAVKTGVSPTSLVSPAS